MAELAATGGLPSHLSAAEIGALGDFAAGARRRLGEALIGLRLFGSRARGRGGESSDVDVAVIVTAEGRARRCELYDLAFDLQLQTGVPLAPLVIEQQRLAWLRAHQRRLAADIDAEGIEL